MHLCRILLHFPSGWGCPHPSHHHTRLKPSSAPFVAPQHIPIPVLSKSHQDWRSSQIPVSPFPHSHLCFHQATPVALSQQCSLTAVCSLIGPGSTKSCLAVPSCPKRCQVSNSGSHRYLAWMHRCARPLELHPCLTPLHLFITTLVISPRDCFHRLQIAFWLPASFTLQSSLHFF